MFKTNKGMLKKTTHLVRDDFPRGSLPRKKTLFQSVKINLGRGLPSPNSDNAQKKMYFFLGRLPLFVQVLFYVWGANV